MKQKRYTINDVSKLLGVTPHMLRHYEEMGIIRPEVDRENGYRYYTVIDSRRFNFGRMLLKCGFSLEKAAKLMTDMAPEEREQAFRECIAEQQRQIELRKIAISLLEKMQNNYRNLSQMVDRVWVNHYDRRWRLLISEGDVKKMPTSLVRQQEQWLQFLPAVFGVSRIKSAEFQNVGAEKLQYDFGLVCYEEQAKLFGLEKTPDVDVIPAGDYLVTVHRKDQRETFTWEDIRVLTDYIRDHNIVLHGDAYGSIISSDCEDGVPVNYHMVQLKIYT